MLALSGHVAADPSPLWSPDAATRHALELLVDAGGLQMPLMQWPLPSSAVRRALNALPAVLPPELDAARSGVLRKLNAQQRRSGSLSVRGRNDALTGFGEEATPGNVLMVRSSSLESPLAVIQVGARIETDASGTGGTHLRLDDSTLATEVAGIQVQAWSHRSWWGPGWQSSLALSNNAPAFNGFGFQRADVTRSASPWLAWLGPWNVDVFIAQTEDVTNPANPYLFGNRLSLRPFSQLEIGVTRMAQWGGRGHEQNTRSFLRMLTGAGTNADTVAEQRDDPANQLAGFDVRLGCPAAWHCAAYTQLMGEDQAGLFPSRYLGLYGFENWSADGRQRYVLEYAETAVATPIFRSGIKNVAYRNYAFPEGYTSAHRWIGASSGPDARILTLGWLATDHETSLKVHLGTVGARIGTFNAASTDALYAGHLIGLSARQTWSIGSVDFLPELDWERVRVSAGAHAQGRVGLTARMTLDAPYSAASGGLGAALASDNSPLQPLLVGAALVGGSVLLDRTIAGDAQRHGDKFAARQLRKLGDDLPVAEFGAVGAAWLLQRGSTQGELAFSSLSAGVAAYVASDSLKLAVDRARPASGKGNGSFGGAGRSESSFPSNHSAVAWAIVTPYAEHEDAPWAYGLAALTNVSRTLGHEHWFSDTVAGSILGYVVGDLFYKRSAAAPTKPTMRLSVAPRAVRLELPFE